MPSLRARLVNLALPLLGVKAFMSQPEKMDARITKLRRTKPVRPRARWHKRFDISESSKHGFPVFTFAPKGGAKPGTPHILYLHGGGYVMPIAAVHWDAVARLCEELGASATVPLYPLAPEVTADQTVSAIQSLYGELAAEHGPKNMTVMGDSAGGGMALAVTQNAASAGGDLPASLVLFSPWLDATGSGPGQDEIEPKDRMLSPVGLEACGTRYAGKLELGDTRVSPLFGSLERLPPTAIFAGTSDILLVDARRLVEKLQALGVNDFLYREYEDMFHDWMLLPVPEGKKALSETVDFIRLHHSSEAA